MFVLFLYYTVQKFGVNENVLKKKILVLTKPAFLFDQKYYKNTNIIAIII